MKCLVIGGGAAGLMAGCALARGGAEVVILERQARVGRKLLATGNGRCNFTNTAAGPEYYAGSRREISAVLRQYPARRVLEIFEEMGVPGVVDAEGRAYPGSNQASSVLDALRLTLAEAGGREETGFDVVSIEKKKSEFLLTSADGRREKSRKVLLAAGSPAAPQLGGTAAGVELLKKFGHRAEDFRPILTPLTTETEPIRGLKGLRVRCQAMLLEGETVVCRESGEALFSENGVSGICVMQLSRHLRGLKQPRLELNFVPAYVQSTLFERARRLEMRRLEDFLNGMLPKKLGICLMRRIGLSDLNRTAGSLSRREMSALWNAMSRFSLKITGTCGFDHAQAASGGLDLADFSAETLESRKVPGLYAAGEVLNVDGDCGGFNLQWAWASALTAAEAMLRENDGILGR